MYTKRAFFSRLVTFILILIAYHALGPLEIVPFAAICILLFYGLTEGIVERCLFLIAALPLEQCYCPVNAIYFSYVDIMTFLVILEYVLAAFMKHRESKVHPDKITIMLLSLMMIAAITSSVLGFRSAFTYGQLARFLLAATACAIISRVLLTATMKIGEVGNLALKVVAIQLIVFIIWYLCLFIIEPSRLPYGSYESIFAGGGRLLVSNDLATLLCMSMPCVFAFKAARRALGPVVIFAVYFALVVMTQSRGGLAVFILFSIMFGVSQLMQKKIALVSVLIISIPIALYYAYDIFSNRFENIQNEYRLDLIITYLKIFFDHFLFGIGWGAWFNRGDIGYDSVTDIVKNTSGTSSHNMYLSVGACAGLVFLIPFLLLFIHWVKSLMKIARKSDFMQSRTLISNSQMGLIGLSSILFYGMFLDMSNSPFFWITISIIPAMTIRDNISIPLIETHS